MSNVLKGVIIGVITGGLLMAFAGALAGVLFEVIVSVARIGTPMPLKNIFLLGLVGFGVGVLLGVTVGGVGGAVLRRQAGLVIGAATGLLSLALGGAFLGSMMRGPDEPIDVAVTLKLILLGSVVGALAGAGIGLAVDYSLRRLGSGAA